MTGERANKVEASRNKEVSRNKEATSIFSEAPGTRHGQQIVMYLRVYHSPIVNPCSLKECV